MIINKRSSSTAIYEPDSLTEIEKNASWKLKLWFCCTDKILKVEYTEVKCFELNTLTSVIFLTLALHFAMNKFFRVRLDCFLPLKLIWNEVLYLNTLIRRICAFIINQKYQDQKYCLHKGMAFQSTFLNRLMHCWFCCFHDSCWPSPVLSFNEYCYRCTLIICKHHPLFSHSWLIHLTEFTFLSHSWVGTSRLLRLETPLWRSSLFSCCPPVCSKWGSPGASPSVVYSLDPGYTGSGPCMPPVTSLCFLTGEPHSLSKLRCQSLYLEQL